ncbi:MAG: caspase family protein [Myxococcota bacterium]
MRWSLLLLLLLAVPAQARRLALVVGENRGLASEEQLRFAERDAQRVRQALLDVGGFGPDEVLLLRGADAPALRASLAALRAELEQAPAERVLLYVSSHASEGVLHLAGTELPLQELVDFLKTAKVRVGLLVVDACQSGAVTKLKGLKPTGAPVPPRLEATGVEGRVLISASGADEYAQESDALEGSYFTHYLVTGLRGAADSSRDGRVTLDEVYAWAWARTIEATFSTRGGVQRPAFSVDLRGVGQLVLSEPQKSPSRLTLDVQAPGRWLLVSDTSGALFADVDKGEGPLSLAVPPDTYRVQLRLRDTVLERRLTVPPGGQATLAEAELGAAPLLRVARKGGEESVFVLSAAGSLTSGLVLGLVAEPGGELRLRRDGHVAGFLNQLQVTLGARGGASVSRAFEHLELELRAGAGHRFALERGSLALGLELGPMLTHQWALPDQSQRWSLGLALSLGLEGRLKLGGPVELFALVNGGGAVARKLIGVTFVPRVTLAFGVALSL